MTTDAMHDSVTSLTDAQLIEAYAASTSEQDTRFHAFLAVADLTVEAARTGGDVAEAKAEMNGLWTEYKAQQAMTWAIINELTARKERAANA